MPDFGRPGVIRLSEAYRQKRKHIDAHAIGESFNRYLVFPTTFDGGLPSESLGSDSSRLLIGETYQFDDFGENGLIGTVTAAVVDESAKCALIAVTDSSGKSQFLRRPMSDMALTEYREVGDAYFGRPALKHRETRTPFELFEWLMEVNKTISREKMLAWFSPSREGAELENLNDEDLRIEYCEALVAAVEAKKRS